MNARREKILFLAAILLVGVPLFAFAGTSTGMPWEDTLDIVLRSLTGPVPRVIGIILVVAGGIALAVTEGQAVKKLFWVLIGVGIALNAADIIARFFGGATGALVPFVGM